MCEYYTNDPVLKLDILIIMGVVMKFKIMSKTFDSDQWGHYSREIYTEESDAIQQMKEAKSMSDDFGHNLEFKVVLA